MHNMAKHIPFPAVGRDGQKQHQLSHRTAFPLISALSVHRGLSAVKTHALICPLQIPAPTPFSAGKARPQGLLPTLCQSLGCSGQGCASWLTMQLPRGTHCQSHCGEPPALQPKTTTALQRCHHPTEPHGLSCVPTPELPCPAMARQRLCSGSVLGCATSGAAATRVGTARPAVSEDGAAPAPALWAPLLCSKSGQEVHAADPTHLMAAPLLHIQTTEPGLSTSVGYGTKYLQRIPRTPERLDTPTDIAVHKI